VRKAVQNGVPNYDQPNVA